MESRERFGKELELNDSDMSYFVFSNSITNNAYSPTKDNINLMFKDGSVKDIAKASDQLNITYLSEEVKKHFLCTPKKAMINDLKKQRQIRGSRVLSFQHETVDNSKNNPFRCRTNNLLLLVHGIFSPSNL